jgi:hypothetical protein
VHAPEPVLGEIDPPGARVGDLVVVTGQFLGRGPPDGKLYFYGTPVTQIESWTEGSIKFRIPKPGDRDVVWVETGGATSNELDFQLLKPTIKAIRPEAALPGEAVEIAGLAFTESAGAVLFGAPPTVGKVVAWTDARITAIVPPGLTGEVSVKVRNDAGTSSARPLALLRQPPGGAVGATPFEGQHAAMVLDHRDFPHIVYYDQEYTSPRHLWWTGWEWKSESLPVDRAERTADVPGTRGVRYLSAVGHYPAVAYDVAQRLHVTCFDVFRQRLEYGVSGPGVAGWKFMVVDPGGGDAGLFSSVKVDESGRAHIAYMELTKGQLRYALGEKDGFHVAVVDDQGQVGITVALALDPRGNPQMAYLDYERFHLKFAWAQGGKFQSMPVDQAGWVGDNPSLAVDAAGMPHIAYGERDGSGAVLAGIRYATFRGNRWQVEQVEKGPGVGSQPSLALGPDGRIHLVYVSLQGSAIHHAVRRKNGWKIRRLPVERLRASVDVGDCRMALGRDGLARIIYWTSAPTRLEYRVIASE